MIPYLPQQPTVLLKFKASRISPRLAHVLIFASCIRRIYWFVVNPGDGFAVGSGCFCPVVECEDVLGLGFVCESITRVRGAEIQSHHHSRSSSSGSRLRMIHCHSSPPPPPPPHLQNNNSCQKVSELALSQRFRLLHDDDCRSTETPNYPIPRFTSKPQLNNQVLRSLSIGQAINHKTLCSRNSTTQQNLLQKSGEDARGLLSTESSGTRSIVAFELYNSKDERASELLLVVQTRDPPFFPTHKTCLLSTLSTIGLAYVLSRRRTSHKSPREIVCRERRRRRKPQRLAFPGRSLPRTGGRGERKMPRSHRRAEESSHNAKRRTPTPGRKQTKPK